MTVIAQVTVVGPSRITLAKLLFFVNRYLPIVTATVELYSQFSVILVIIFTYTTIYLVLVLNKNNDVSDLKKVMQTEEHLFYLCNKDCRMLIILESCKYRFSWNDKFPLELIIRSMRSLNFLCGPRRG